MNNHETIIKYYTEYYHCLETAKPDFPVKYSRTDRSWPNDTFFKNTKGFWGSGASEGHRKIDPPQKKNHIKKTPVLDESQE